MRLDTPDRPVAVVGSLAALACRGRPRARRDIASLQAKVDQAAAEARTLAAAVQLRSAELEAAAADARAAAGARQQVLEAQLARGARARTAARGRGDRRAGAPARRPGPLPPRHRTGWPSGWSRSTRADTPDLATVLLEADGFSDLLTRAAYLKEINDADQALVDRIQALRDEVRAALARVRAARAEAAAEVQRLAAARDEIAQVRAAAQARAARLARARAAQQAALSTLRSRMAGWTAQVRQLQQAAAPAGRSRAQTVEQWFDGFSIPKAIVMCESGGNYNALNPSSGAGGAYQMLPETYKGLGGQYAAPHLAPKSEQDKLAAKLWNDGAGRGNWEC